MMTLEDQIRVYATDIAGPAVGEPPSDLVAAGTPRHRGRWLLVAALLLFVTGLAWTAARPSHSSAPPVVADPPTTLLPVASAPAGSGPCSADGSVTGTLLEGPDGDGLCVSARELGGDKVLLQIFTDGRELVRFRLSPCTDPAAAGYPPFAVELPGGPILSLGFVPPGSAYGRLESDPAHTTLAAFDLTAVPGTRVVVARVATSTSPADIRPLDDTGSEIQSFSFADAPTCLANDGTPTVTTLPEN